jgi:hypothetical protein
MKLTKILLATAVVGAMAFAASTASAFPLTVKAFSGTANTTAVYGTTATTTSAKYDKASYNLKKVLQVITNELALRGTNVAAANTLMYDPFLNITYLTNNLGYYVNLSAMNIAQVYFWDIATSFKGTANNGSENDIIDVELWVHHARPPGSTNEIDIDAWGAGNLTTSVNSKGVVKMTVTEKGTGYCQVDASDDGVITGSSFNLNGSGTVTSGQMPYSIYWWNY